jgi:hypothetical protein
MVLPEMQVMVVLLATPADKATRVTPELTAMVVQVATQAARVTPAQ